MKKRNALACFIALLLSTTAVAQSTHNSHPTSPPQLPPSVAQTLQHNHNINLQTLGYTTEQMLNFGRHEHLLPAVLRSFHSVSNTIRFAHHATDQLISAADHEDELLRHALENYLSIHAGRRIRIPLLDTRGISGELPDAYTFPDRTRGIWTTSLLRDTNNNPLQYEDAFATALRTIAQSDPNLHTATQSFARLPRNAKTLIIRSLITHIQTTPWINTSIDHDLLASPALQPFRNPTTNSLYHAAIATRDDTLTPPLPRQIFDLVDSTDLPTLSYAAILAAKRTRLALHEYTSHNYIPTASEREALHSLNITIQTPQGPIILAGTQDNHHTASFSSPPSLVIDFGGNDTYTGPFAVADGSVNRPLAILIDLAGADTFRPEDPNDPATKPPANTASQQPNKLDTYPTLASANFGLSLLYNLGNSPDAYNAHVSSIASAWQGIALLIDEAGNDTYNLTTQYGQASAFAGLALLLDKHGNDFYSAAAQAQAIGMTRGAAVLLDVNGHDFYEIRDDGAPSELYLGRTVAMGQGCGYGRRADLSDAKSMAGGVGALIDAQGDDHYHAMAWAQGAAYWWGLGILDDRQGNDTYRNGKYSMGAAAHFATGVFTDHNGNDRYNTAKQYFKNPFNNQHLPVAENQFAGHARDGSIGLFLDLNGNDHHVLRANCAGNADLNSIALFWDAKGNDTYEGLEINPNPDNPNWQRPPLGSATTYPKPFNTYRDDLHSIGLFLDTQGRDRYLPSLKHPNATNNSTWTESHHPPSKPTNPKRVERAVAIDTNN